MTHLIPPAHLFIVLGTLVFLMPCGPVFAVEGDEPVATFGYSPTDHVAGFAVQFTGTSEGLPTSWWWTFDDGWLVR